MKFGALWIGDNLPNVQKTCLASFIYYGHEVDLYVYDMSISVPDGVVKKDASEILPESRIFVVDESYAGFSDLFRYHMIQKTGRTWIDCDQLCMSADWDFEEDILASIEYSLYGFFIVGGVLRLPQNSEILDYVIDYAESFDKTQMHWAEIGPSLLTEAFEKFGLTDKAQPQEVLLGIPIHEFKDLWDPSKLDYFLSFNKNTKSISLYNQLISKEKLDKNNFPEGSAMEYFYNKFIPNNLRKLPKIYYINLPEATDRNQSMLDMFAKYEITNFERYEAKRYSKSGHRNLSPAQFGCMMSHIDVCKLIFEGEDEYAIILEDDIDLSTADIWQFTWKELMKKVPEFDILQLHRQQLFEFDEAKLRPWGKWDHSTAAYVITKSYARGILKLYQRNKESLAGFKPLSGRTGPVADYSMYYHGNTYSTCIFNVKKFPSQIAAPGDLIQNALKTIDQMFEKPLSLDDIIK
jgi:hypothetical protein